ncbi:hypothetical protein REPUB_Repub13aG0086200 [Reevesia pubescens]
MTSKSTQLLPLFLPYEIVYDILLRLPVKSLKRFKLVSKPWDSLLSDPNFVESHLHRANTSQDLLRIGQIRVAMEPRPCLSLYSMDSNGSNRELVTLDYTFHDYLAHAQILGSCNGLLLIVVDHKTFFLWNPSTGKYKKIPHVYLSDEAMIISGLGYESTTTNYKGIIVSHYISGSSSPHRFYDNYEAVDCVVYNCEKNSWTMKDFREFRFPYNLCTSSSAVMINGVPHWCVYDRVAINSDEDDRPFFRILQVRVRYLIVYFDLDEEKLEEVQLPECVTDEMEFELGVLGGCLSMSLVDPHGSLSTEIWGMREYRKPESWTKLFVISTSFRQLRPICFARNNKNEVVMEVDGWKLMVFNLKENTQRILLLDNGSWLRKCTYLESLVFVEENENQANNEESNEELDVELDEEL